MSPSLILFYRLVTAILSSAMVEDVTSGSETGYRVSIDTLWLLTGRTCCYPLQSFTNE